MQNPLVSRPRRTTTSSQCPPDADVGAAPDAPLPDVLQALSDPVRLHIVRLAARGERACCEFGLDLPKATLSHHFKVLRAAGIIDSRREGTRYMTVLRKKELDARFPGLLKAVLNAAEEEA